MTKYGILHDYDLMANQEESAQKENICVICGNKPILYQWSDYSGEAMCTICGCPYQLKWGSQQQQTDNKYPYLNLKDDFVPIFQEYWNEFHQFVCLGKMLGGPMPGYSLFVNWIKKHYPEWIKKEE